MLALGSFHVDKRTDAHVSAIGRKHGKLCDNRGGIDDRKQSAITGLLAATTNMLAAFHLIRSMPAKDKVLVVAFGTTSSALIGDHLAFTANFQPNLIAPLMIGKVVAGVTAMLLALWIAVPTAKRLEREDAEAEIEAADDDPERSDDEDRQTPEPVRS